MFFNYCVLFVLVLSIFYIKGNKLNKNEGDFCTDAKNAVGRCTSLQSCPGIHPHLHNVHLRPILCGFNASMPVVCCTSENMGLDHNGMFVSKKVGDLANEHCNKYSLLTHTWVQSPLYNFSGTLINTCRQTPDELSMVPYPHPLPREYPYMVALGVGSIENLEYICSGTLVSEQFVLTTITCAKESGHGLVRWALVGDFNLYEELDDSLPELSEVKNIVTNTESSSTLALVEVKHKFELSRYVIPACLPTSTLQYTKGFATGWYLPKFQGDMSKALLSIVPFSECQDLNKIRSPRVGENQICGKPPMVSDYCQRTIGDPLVVHRSGIHCMYDIIGVTSLSGQPCDDVSIFADVTSNIVWLEQVIWGSQKNSALPQNISNILKPSNSQNSGQPNLQSENPQSFGSHNHNGVLFNQNRPMRGQNKTQSNSQQNNESGQQSSNDRKMQMGSLPSQNQNNKQIVWYKYGNTYRQSHIRTEISNQNSEISDRQNVRIEYLLNAQNNYKDGKNKF